MNLICAGDAPRMNGHTASDDAPPSVPDEGKVDPKVERCQKNTIRLPLAQQQIFLLKSALPEGALMDEVISLIEGCVNSVDPSLLYNEITKELTPIFKEKTKQIVGMLFMYKKKPCREGSYCTKGERCIFLHSKDVQAEDENLGQDECLKANGKRRIDFDDDSKRVHGMPKNSEVILNRVPKDYCDENKVMEFAKAYGDITEVKRLNEGKYMIRFKDQKSAQEMIESDVMPFECPEVTKFFNTTNCRTSESVDELFKELFNVLSRVYYVCSDKALFSRLKYLCHKIKERSKIKECNSKRNGRKRQNIEVPNDSLYVNQFR